MTPAEAIELAIQDAREHDRWDRLNVTALREALQIVEGVARVREALDAGAQNLSGVSRAAYHYVLSTDGVAPWPAGIYEAERESNLANTAELHRADALIGELREALWAVRVLDRWADRKRIPTPAVCPNLTGGFSVSIHGVGATRDAARIAAAKALVTEDPTLNPPELEL